MMPVRWMAPETLRDGTATSASDVWSFGIVLWEMVTLAEQPYQGLSNQQVVDRIINGYTIPKPEGCPEELYQVMRDCWQKRETQRPTFLDLCQRFSVIANTRFRENSFFYSPEGRTALASQEEVRLAAAEEAAKEDTPLTQNNAGTVATAVSGLAQNPSSVSISETNGGGGGNSSNSNGDATSHSHHNGGTGLSLMPVSGGNEAASSSASAPIFARTNSNNSSLSARLPSVTFITGGGNSSGGGGGEGTSTGGGGGSNSAGGSSGHKPFKWSAVVPNGVKKLRHKSGSAASGEC